MKATKNVLCLTVATALISVGALAQSQTRPGPHAATYNSELQIGPVPGLTTAWHPAPTHTAVPLGATIQFKVPSRGASSVEWKGARNIARRGAATAECRLKTPGPHTVSMTYTLGNGERVQESSQLTVVDTSIFPVNISRPRLSVDPMLLDEGSTNETTMRYFFGDSIAAVRQIGDGHYLTSTKRWFHLEVDVEPAGFAPLLEWRVNDNIQNHLGAAIMMQVYPPRRHAIEVGSTDDPQKITLDAYMVYITSHSARVEDIPEYSPVTFSAVTIPPGHEDEITWLASTKYGSCDSVMGHGPEFTISFRNTSGAEGQWLGVKADNATVAQDGKGTPSFLTGSLTTDSSDLDLEMEIETNGDCIDGTWALRTDDGHDLGSGTLFGTRSGQTVNLSMKPSANTILEGEFGSDGSLDGSILEGGIPIADILVLPCFSPDLAFDITGISAFDPLRLCNVDDEGNAMFVIRNRGAGASQATTVNGTLRCLGQPDIQDMHPIEPLASGEAKTLAVALPPDCGTVAEINFSIDPVEGECYTGNNTVMVDCLPSLFPPVP